MLEFITEKISHKFSNSWLTIAKESVRHSTTTNAEDFVVHAFLKVYLANVP